MSDHQFNEDHLPHWLKDANYRRSSENVSFPQWMVNEARDYYYNVKYKGTHYVAGTYVEGYGGKFGLEGAWTRMEAVDLVTRRKYESNLYLE